MQQKIKPDPKYDNIIISKFINYTMRKGKKFLAQKITYDAFDLIEKKTKKDPVSFFEKSLENAKPRIETKPTRVGGATYQVPYEVDEKRGKFLAMKWILEEAKKKKGRSMPEKLAEEIILSSKKEGGAIKKKIDTEKMAEANKAFAHLARR
ncbi:MAG: 30S ribosomal protein S7 [Candidatus Pacebacteria bacterium]|nr:30S ribosomal protein S7 [Candidatus Paceibacterota bacterium]